MRPSNKPALLNHEGFWSKDTHFIGVKPPKHKAHKRRRRKMFANITFTRSHAFSSETLHAVVVLFAAR